MNRILRIDLTEMKAWPEDSAELVPDFLGGRGLAIKVAWDGFDQPVDPFDPGNPLMIFPGALTGASAPYAGRTTVCSFSPQGYPFNWLTRSNVGGWIGGNIKRAGYDGIVVTGSADQPIRVRVSDDEVAFLPADDLWGVDALDTLDAIANEDGKRFHSLAIGPAGERLSRIATIQTNTSSACGQGGFGAVMGSKKLKAISVAGTYKVKLASPGAISNLARQIARAVDAPNWFGIDMASLKADLAREGNGSVRLRACSEGCLTPCQTEFRDMPGSVHKRKWSGDWVCVSAILLMGYGEDAPKPRRETCAWQLDRRAAFEMNVLTNRYGLNQFDILSGMVPWLIACQRFGLISELNGRLIDWNSPQFWGAFLRDLAHREGIGDILAEGGWRASQILGIGEELASLSYPGWGHSSHWDGHQRYDPPFPFWIAPALQWLADTRDPFNSGHGSLKCRFFTDAAAAAESDGDKERLFAAARDYGKRIYGTEGAADPYSGYEGKAEVGYFHTIRPVIKDCLPVDDMIFPLTLNYAANDYQHVFSDPEDGSEIEGKDMEARLFALGTGTQWAPEEFEKAAARVYNLERALLVRHWGRDRSIDEMVLPYFDRTESYVNPFLDKRHGLDRGKFKKVLDRFYTLHGWDVETGQPTKDRLVSLGLKDVYEKMTDRQREKVKDTPEE